MCDNSHLSLEFITRKSDGQLLYNGPIVPPEPEEVLVSGKIAIFILNLFLTHLKFCPSLGMFKAKFFKLLSWEAPEKNYKAQWLNI